MRGEVVSRQRKICAASSVSVLDLKCAATSAPASVWQLVGWGRFLPLLLQLAVSTNKCGGFGTFCFHSASLLMNRFFFINGRIVNSFK